MSKPVSIELDGLFKAFDISSVEEVTLGKVPLNTLGLQFYQNRGLISFNKIFNDVFEHLTFLTIENVIGSVIQGLVNYFESNTTKKLVFNLLFI